MVEAAQPLVGGIWGDGGDKVLIVIACLTGVRPISPEDGPRCHSGPSHSLCSHLLPPPLLLHYLALFLHLILRQQGGLRSSSDGGESKKQFDRKEG